MTGGFYDYRRSKLKFMSTIRENMKSIKTKEDELNKIRDELQDILWKQFSFCFFGWVYMIICLYSCSVFPDNVFLLVEYSC